MRTIEEQDLELEEELSDYERERGKPMPSIEHSFVQGELTIQIAAHHLAYRPYPELSLDLEGYRSIPDICVYEKDSLRNVRKEMHATIPPLLAIEILSPKQALRSLFDKAEAYLSRGVDETWIVIPEIHSITVCRLNQKQQTFISGDVCHQSTGITVNIEQLFADIL